MGHKRFRSAIALACALWMLILPLLACNLSERLRAMKNAKNGNARRTYGNTPPAVKLEMFRGTTAADAAPKIKEKLGDHVKIVQMLIYPDSISMQVQDPDNPENVDLYRYDANGLSRVRPVGLGSILGPGGKDLKLENFLFDLNEIDLTATPQLAQKALERISVEGSRVSLMEISRGGWGSLLTKDKDVKWDVSVSGTRKGGYVRFDTKGKEKFVRINDNF